MRRLPVVAFAALVVATAGAFFVTQHLKVADPLINGSPRPDPPAINPLSGRTCRDLAGKLVSFKRTHLNFYLQARSDNVAVYMVNTLGEIEATVAANRYMHVNRRYTFTWDGRQGTGHGPVAPDGTYYFRIALQNENRTFTLTNIPVQVLTTPPHPDVTAVTVPGSASPRGPAIIAPGHPVTIHFRAQPYKTTRVQIYRTDLPGRPRLVFSFGAKGARGKATWNGLIRGAPAPAGTYLVGLAVTDQACNPGTFPVVNPPPPGSTPHAGVTVRDLAAEPPLTPVPAGSQATVLVDSRQRPYAWTLRRIGVPKALGHGREPGGHYLLRIRVPPDGAAVYTLGLQSAGHRTEVPLVASAAGHSAAARVLVVLPALSWVGVDRVDDNGDGLPDTLSAGEQISVQRPLSSGLPPDLGDQEALLQYLRHRRVPYQVTTDLGLAEGAGPSLAGRSGVILDGSLVWLPSSLTPQLASFARSGGRVLSLGTHSLQAQAPLSRSGAGLKAGPPRPLSPDPFGATHGTLAGTSGALITVLTDRLRLFGGTFAFPGFTAAQPITPPNGVPVSLAGVASSAPTITAFRDGRGIVVEVGLPRFASSLERDVDTQELLARVWKLLSR